MDKKERKEVVYTDSFKRMVARESLTGELSVKELAKKYGLPHYNTVTIWRRSFRDKLDDVEHLLERPNTAEEKREIDIYRRKSKELEAELSNAKLKIVALETMIDIAEQELEIKIRKKSGTKQSGK